MPPEFWLEFQFPLLQNLTQKKAKISVPRILASCTDNLIREKQLKKQWDRVKASHWSRHVFPRPKKKKDK